MSPTMLQYLAKGICVEDYDIDNDNENTLFDHNIQIEITIYKQFK